MQWLDKRVVSVLSIMHSATKYTEKTRKRRVNRELQDVTCRKPVAIKHYNANMRGVDIFDQLARTYRILRRSKKFNKGIFIYLFILFITASHSTVRTPANTKGEGVSQPRQIFYDLLQIATINAYKLFAAWREANPGAIKRPVRYSQYQFREQLVSQPVNLPMHSAPPALERAIPAQAADYRQVHSAHIPNCAGEPGRANCVVCWKQDRKRSKTAFFCSNCTNRESHPVHLCIGKGKKCFRVFHSPEYDAHR